MTSIQTARADGGRGVAAGLAAVVVLADLLFWHEQAGFSLVVFSAVLVAVGALQHRRLPPAAAGAWLVGALPVAEHVQALSLAFLAAGTAGALACIRLPDGSLKGRAAAALRLTAQVPAGGVPVALRRVRAMARTARFRPAAVAEGWALPVGGGLLVLSLLADANPLIGHAMRMDMDGWRLATRALFWMGIALACLPLLDPAALREPRGLPVPPPGALPGINAASTLRALVVFNALVGVQTVLDASILIGGADLPAGLTFAAYAHRGAFPLLATALLAGAFAMAAQPTLRDHPLMRPLMLLWLAQNVVLCLSALLRLDLYVDAYGLTLLRLHAMVWMGLVAVGLGLTAWQVARGHGRGWLLWRCAGLGAGTLYVCCFINFTHVVAVQNLARVTPDAAYLCALGPTAAGAFVQAGIDLREASSGTPRPCGTARLMHAGWRDWEFRSWRVARYIGVEKGPRA